MAQPRASRVKVDTASPPPPPSNGQFISAGPCQRAYLPAPPPPKPSLSSRPRPLWPSHSPQPHLSFPPLFYTLTSCWTCVALPRSLCSFLSMLRQLLAWNRLFFVFCFVFSQCHIGSSGENHSWQLFYSFFYVFCLFLFSTFKCDIYIFVIEYMLFFLSLLSWSQWITNAGIFFYYW